MFNMGQTISSTNHHHQHSSSHEDSNSSVIYRERQNASTLPNNAATTATTTTATEKLGRRSGLDLARVRPVTISAPPINFNAEKELKKLEIVTNKNAGVVAEQQQNSSALENGYHKTDYCYYRTPQGNFHKLPTDSYHKMSEGCYIRLADGNFRRLHLLDKSATVGGGKKLLDPATALGNSSQRNSMTIHSNSGSTNNNNNVGGGVTVGDKSSSKVKSQMMKFLKRSKSHTPATVKQLQSYHKEGGYIDRKLNNKLGHEAGGGNTALNALTPVKEGSVVAPLTTTTNNKVVVTMMENGGLPIVATSKAEKFKNRESAAVAKAKKVIYTAKEKRKKNV